MSKSKSRIPDLQGSPTASAATYSTAVEHGDVVVSPETLPPSLSSARSRSDSEKRSLLYQAAHRLQLYAPPIESVRTVLGDFQDFIQQGNMIDLAIGLILGKAFTDILNSFVIDILSPIISLFSERSIANYYFVARCPLSVPHCTSTSWETWKQARDVGAVTINYGLFLENVINFVINAIFLYIAIKKFFEVVFERNVNVKKQCPFCKEFIKGAATRGGRDSQKQPPSHNPKTPVKEPPSPPPHGSRGALPSPSARSSVSTASVVICTRFLTPPALVGPARTVTMMAANASPVASPPRRAQGATGAENASTASVAQKKQQQQQAQARPPPSANATTNRQTGATATARHDDDNLSCHALLLFLRDQVRYARQNMSRNHVIFFLKQHIPILEWLPSYDLREDLQYDIVAGVTVGMMIVPQEISLSTMMGVPPNYGLYTAALVPMIYPLFGTSRVLSVANGAEVSLLVGSAIKKIESVEERVATGILLSFLSGLILLMMGVFRLGILADFFSRPVMGGFISAGGVLIMLSQCANWFGVKVPSRDLPFLSVLDLIEQSTHMNGKSFFLGLISILILFGMRYLKRSVVREMAKLEEELEEEFELESVRAEQRQNEFMDGEASGSSGGDEDEDDGESTYEDIELGDVAATNDDPTSAAAAKKKKSVKKSSSESLTDPDVDVGKPNRKQRRPGMEENASGTPRMPSSRWQNLPSVFSTSALRRSDFVASPWAPNARRLNTTNDLFEMEARSCRQSDISTITRSTRHRMGNSNSMMDEGVGFSLSDEDYLSREQPLEYSFMNRRTAAATDDAANRRVSLQPPSLVRSNSESSVISRTPGGPTPRRRKNSVQGMDEMKAPSSPARTATNDEQDDSSWTTETDASADQLPKFTRVKNMASPAKSIASDTDSACSTTALTGRSTDSFASNSMSIRIIRSKIAVLIALRLVCELGAFMVCLIGGIIGYLSSEGDLVLTGKVPGGYPSPILPWYGFLTKVIETDRLYHIIIDTLSIAIISYMSSIAMAKRLAIKEGYRIRPNQELIALGFSNLAGSFFQSMPATGGLSRTAVNMQNARTQLASLITVGVVVLALYTATSALAYLPKASLAAIIIVAGQSLIETKEAKWLYRVKRDEFYVWLASFVLTVTLGVLPGLLSSIFCSLVAVIYKTRRPMLTMLGEIVDEASGEQRLVDLDLYPDTARPLSDIVVIRVEGALYFANCEYIERVIEREISKRQQTEGVVVHGVIIDACSIMDWDSTTIQMMKHLQEDLLMRSIQLAIVNARDRLHALLESSDYLYGIVRNDSRIGFDEAISAIRELALVSPANLQTLGLNLDRDGQL